MDLICLNNHIMQNMFYAPFDHYNPILAKSKYCVKHCVAIEFSSLHKKLFHFNFFLKNMFSTETHTDS